MMAWLRRVIFDMFLKKHIKKPLQEVEVKPRAKMKIVRKYYESR